MKVISLTISLLLLWALSALFGSEAHWQVDMGSFGLDGIVVGLKATALANFFAMLIAVGLFSISFISSKYKLGTSFYALLYLLVASLFLIVYAEDYLLFFVGWEVMSVTTYLLFSYSLSREALIKYIVFALASAMSLLAGIMILYSASHSFLYSEAQQGFIALSATLQVIFVLLMLFAFFVKLGMIGFHYWLVDSYEQSSDFFTPYLSAVLSKMGIYALIILLVYVIDIRTISHTWIAYTLAIMGLLSSLIATFKAVNEDSMKRLLAYSSIAQLGYIVTVLSMADGLGGALYHSLIHTLVKLLLFINVAGIIYMTSRSKFSELGGLIYRMPQSFVLLLIGIISLAGMPPLAGFASKFLIYTTLLEGGSLLILSAMLFASASAFLYIYKLIYGIYLGHPTSKRYETIKEMPISFLIPQYLLSAILVGIGIFPGIVIPYFNTILEELKLETIPFESYAILGSEMATYNGLVLMSAFAAVFVLILLFMLSLRSKAKNVKDRFDIAYCGEVPDESTHLHYGYSMGKELRRVGFIGVILKNSSSVFYEYISKQLFGFATILRKIYSGNLSLNFNIAALFALILLWWGLK